MAYSKNCTLELNFARAQFLFLIYSTLFLSALKICILIITSNNKHSFFFSNLE